MLVMSERVGCSPSWSDTLCPTPTSTKQLPTSPCTAAATSLTPWRRHSALASTCSATVKRLVTSTCARAHCAARAPSGLHSRARVPTW